MGILFVIDIYVCLLGNEYGAENKELRQLTGAIHRTASRDLDDLVKKGLFRKVGKTGRGAYYVLAKKTGQKQDKQDISSTRSLTQETKVAS